MSARRHGHAPRITPWLPMSASISSLWARSVAREARWTVSLGSFVIRPLILPDELVRMSAVYRRWPLGRPASCTSIARRSCWLSAGLPPTAVLLITPSAVDPPDRERARSSRSRCSALPDERS
jgi:hypothetical protein